MTTEIDQQPRRGRGRPSTFDRQEALGRAMQLFWEHGYEGTSFDQLTEAMGIRPSTFYNSFGSKERLYNEAVEAYLKSSADWFMGSLFDTADARQAFASLLDATALAFTGTEHPAGCMISLQGTHLSLEHDAVRAAMTSHRASAEEEMRRRLRKAVEDGDLRADANVEAIAAFYSAVTRGMAVQARDGASLDKLRSIADMAMQAWPR